MSDDVVAILATFSRYAQAMADRRFDIWADQWTVDASLVLRGRTYRGREELINLMTERLKDDATTKIMWCNPVIELNGDVAHAKTDCIVLAEADPHPGLFIRNFVRYQDVLRKEDDRWLIHERCVISSS